jgi:hypothetical protein
VYQRSPRHEGITEGHLPLLAEGHRLIKDGLREGQDLRQTKERFHILLLLVIELMIPENLDITDSRNGRRVLGNELSQVGVCRLGRIDEDLAIDEHYPSRPVKLRS